MDEKKMAVAVEKGCTKAWLKMFTWTMGVYAIFIGVWYGWTKWEQHKIKKQRENLSVE